MTPDSARQHPAADFIRVPLSASMARFLYASVSEWRGIELSIETATP
jgi:hypothetical protein